MKPFSVVAIALVASVLSAPVLADTPPGLNAGLFSSSSTSVTGGIVASPFDRNQRQSEQIVAQQSFDNRSAAARFQRELQNFPSNPQFAAQQSCRGSVECLESLRPELEAIAEKAHSEKAARNKAYETENSERASATEAAQQPINAAYVATGDLEALKSSCYKEYGASACVDKAFSARVSALKAKAVKPKSCREYGFANDYFLNGAEPLKVSLSAPTAVGFFQGEVVEIDGKTITLFNRATQQNGVVLTEKATVYGATNIAVGSVVIGYGVQTRVLKAKTVAGVTTNVAVITASCLGDKEFSYFDNPTDYRNLSGNRLKRIKDPDPNP